MQQKYVVFYEGDDKRDLQIDLHVEEPTADIEVRSRVRMNVTNTLNKVAIVGLIIGAVGFIMGLIGYIMFAINYPAAWFPTEGELNDALHRTIWGLIMLGTFLAATGLIVTVFGRRIDARAHLEGLEIQNI